MTVIAIINQKGGTGKTTTTINLGSALFHLGQKVLLVDLDPQGNLSYSLGVNDFQYSMSDVLLGEKKLVDILHEREGLQIAPSNIQLADAELSLASSKNRESILTGMISTLKGFDFVLIDCPPSLSVLTVNALHASHKIIIPMQMEVLSLQGLDQIVQTVQKVNEAFGRSIVISGILPVMVDKRRKLSREVHDYILENYDLRIFKSHIRTNVKASEAPSFGQSVITYQPTANSSLDYLRFGEEFLALNKH